MRLPWRTRSEPTVSVGDARAFAAFFNHPASHAGVHVTEQSALGVAAVWRAVSLISGTIAGLPLHVFRGTGPDRTPVEVPWLNEHPAGPEWSMTRFEWVETIVRDLLLYGNAYLVHQRTGGGLMAGALPYHPSCVVVEWERVAGRATGRKEFQLSDVDGRSFRLSEADVTHIPGLAYDGLKGWSVLSVARDSLGKAIAADRAAARAYGNGAAVAGLVSPEEDIDDDEADTVRSRLAAEVSGWENAAKVAFVNRRLKFTPWTMKLTDAQFLESRQFEVEEVARWFGVPPHLLMQTEKQTSWGTGVAEQNRGLARYSLSPWTNRIQQRLRRMFAGRECEFDFAGLLRPSPEQEIPLLISQVEAGLLTANEARAALGRAPLPGREEA